jgi:hypothetical protein
VTEVYVKLPLTTMWMPEGFVAQVECYNTLFMQCMSVCMNGCIYIHVYG